MEKRQDQKEIDASLLFAEGNLEEKLTAIINASDHKSTIKAKKTREIKASLRLFSLAVDLSLDGVIIGNLTTAKLTIAEGAMFEGKCTMLDEDEVKGNGKQQSATAAEDKKAEVQK